MAEPQKYISELLRRSSTKGIEVVQGLPREAILKKEPPRRCQRHIPGEGHCRNRGNLLLVEAHWLARPKWYCRPCVDVLMEMLGYPEITEVENLKTGEVRQVSQEGNA